MDIALIRKQPTAEIGEIVAAIITTSEESLDVLKRFHHYEKKKNFQHVWLASSNPLSEHLIIIPQGANKDEIRKFYIGEIEAGRITNQIKYYDDAKIKIAGKYVGSKKVISISPLPYPPSKKDLPAPTGRSSFPQKQTLPTPDNSTPADPDRN